MYSGGFYPYSSLEEYWAWWSRHIYYNRYVDIPKPVYLKLLEIVKDKDYFVLTTSELVPHCPVCGKPMTMNLRCDNTFVRDEGWYAAQDRYTDFLRRHEGLNLHQ